MASLEVFEKQSLERLDYDVDYEDFFGESDVDEVATAIAEIDIDEVGGLDIDAPVVVIGNPSRQVKVWLVGGVNGHTYKVTVRATTDSQRIVETDFKVKIKDR